MGQVYGLVIASGVWLTFIIAALIGAMLAELSQGKRGIA
jgi:hypothetical protein